MTGFSHRINKEINAYFWSSKNVRNVFYLALTGLLIACGPSEDELNARDRAEAEQVEKDRIEAERTADHEAIDLNDNKVLIFKDAKCSIVFPGLEYEGELHYEAKDEKTTIIFETEEGQYVLETIEKTPESDLYLYFNGALVGMDIRYGYSGMDNAKRDTIDGMYRVNYKTQGYSGIKNHGSHRFFYKNGVVYGMYCINTGSHMDQALVDAYFDSFEFIE